MKTSEDLQKQLSLLTDSGYYTVEQKRGAIEAYLSGGQSLESISNQFGIKGSSTLMRWLTRLGLYEPTKRTSVRYTKQFKMEVANLAQMGFESMDSLRRKYNIKGSMTISRWCKKYPLTSYLRTSKKKSMQQKEKDTQALVAKIKELETKLASTSLKLEVYEEMVAIAKRDYNMDLKKKYNTKPSPS